MNEYVGKICPYCRTAFQEKDTIVVCDTCEMPMHLSCWQENQGCATFGCSGKIKKVIQPVVSAPAAPKAMPVTPQEALPEGETLYESKEVTVLEGVAIENVRLCKRADGSLYALCLMRTMTESPVSALLMDFACKDVWGEKAEPINGVQYLDLSAKRGDLFGSQQRIDIPDRNVRSIYPVIKKLLYQDGTVAECTGEGRTFPKMMPLGTALQDGNLREQYLRETGATGKYLPVLQAGIWRCGCGCLNWEEEEQCPCCNIGRAAQLDVLADPELPLRAAQYTAEKERKEETERQMKFARMQAEADAEKKALEKKARDAEIFRMLELEENEAKRKKLFAGIALAVVALMVLVIGIAMISGSGVDSIDIKQTTVSLEVDESYRLEYQIYPEKASGKKVKWNSSNPSVASVSNNGYVYTHKEGICTITATAGSARDTVQIEVTYGPDFRELYRQYCNSTWASAGSDGSYLSIDTNPFDWDDDGLAYPAAYYAVEKINNALGLPSSLYAEIGETRGIDGKQTRHYSGVTVTWSYHPDKGLEIMYLYSVN